MVGAPAKKPDSATEGLGRRYLPPSGAGATGWRGPGRGTSPDPGSEALADFVEKRAESRHRNDLVIRDHEYAHRRVTLHDLETCRVYLAEHLPGISDLREQFASRGIRSRELDRYFASPENEADLRTISTALLEMASRLDR